jgi:hypothetical protein
MGLQHDLTYVFFTCNCDMYVGIDATLKAQLQTEHLGLEIRRHTFLICKILPLLMRCPLVLIINTQLRTRYTSSSIDFGDL